MFGNTDPGQKEKKGRDGEGDRQEGGRGQGSSALLPAADRHMCGARVVYMWCTWVHVVHMGT